MSQIHENVSISKAYTYSDEEGTIAQFAERDLNLSQNSKEIITLTEHKILK